MLKIKRSSQLVARDVPYIVQPKKALQTLRQRYGVSDHRDLASSHLFEQFKTNSIDFPYVRANDIEDGRVVVLLSTAQYYAVDSKGTVRNFLPSILEFKVRHLLGQPRKENVHQEQAYFAEVKALLEDQYPMPLETAKVVEKPKPQLASANQIMQLARKDLDTGMCQIPEAEEEYWVNTAKGATSMTASQMKEYQEKQITEFNNRSLDAMRFSALSSVSYLGATAAGVTDPSRLAGAAETGMSVGALAAPRSTGTVLNSVIYNASGHPKAPLNSSSVTKTSSLTRYEKFDDILNIPSKTGDTKRGLNIIPSKLNISDYTLPNGKVTQVATDGNAIVQLDKVQKFAQGNVPNVSRELKAMQQFKQKNRKLFDANPANEDKLELLKSQNRNFKRSTAMRKNLQSIGLSDTPANNQLLTEHLLQVGNTVNLNNRVWVPSVLEGPSGKLQVESTWKIIENQKAYLATLKFMPVK